MTDTHSGNKEIPMPNDKRPQCLAFSPAGYTCTDYEGHPGNHVALDSDNKVVDQWSPAPTSADLDAPKLVDRADGAKGHFCIGRVVERSGVDTSEFWNPEGWAAFGYVFKEERLARAVLALLPASDLDAMAAAEKGEPDALAIEAYISHEPENRRRVARAAVEFGYSLGRRETTHFAQQNLAWANTAEKWRERAVAAEEKARQETQPAPTCPTCFSPKPEEPWCSVHVGGILPQVCGESCRQCTDAFHKIAGRL